MADLIDRQDAINALIQEVRTVNGHYCESDEVISKDDAIDAIRMLSSAQPDAPDTNVVDIISRQAALDALHECGVFKSKHVLEGTHLVDMEEVEIELQSLPSAQPEIVFCKDCMKHNKGMQDVLYKRSACPLVKYRGKAQGHEFDYQFCVFGRHKED